VYTGQKRHRAVSCVVGAPQSSQHLSHSSNYSNLQNYKLTNSLPKIFPRKLSQTSQPQFTAVVSKISMDSLSRKRNVSDGDSGFDSALSSRSSSISLEESPEFGKIYNEEDNLLESKLYFLKEKFSSVLTPDEDIKPDDDFSTGLYVITDRVSGQETLFKPPGRLQWCPAPPVVAATYSAAEYDRRNSIPRSQLFHSRLEFELEKQIARMEVVEVDLVMTGSNLSPPPSLGIRVIGLNMIHGVPDKLNIYVKRVVEDSVAGQDGRIRVNDHIIEVNGVSLVGVSQQLAAATLSNCAISPDTGTVHFVLARSQDNTLPGVADSNRLPPTQSDKLEDSGHMMETREEEKQGSQVTKFADKLSSDKKNFTRSDNSFPGSGDQTEFEGRDAVRLIHIQKKVLSSKETLRFSKHLALIGSLLLVSVYAATSQTIE